MAQWFEIEELETDIFCIRESVHVQSFLINGTHSSLLIDTGMGFLDIREALRGLIKPNLMVANTHWHFDHIGGNHLFHEIYISHLEADLIRTPIPPSTLVPFYVDLCQSQKLPLPGAESGFDSKNYQIHGFDKKVHPIQEGHIFDLGNRKIQVIETPGHTRGSLSFLDQQTGSLFVGDLIYDGTLYAQFKDSDPIAYTNTIKRLIHGFPEITVLYAAHNAPCSKREKLFKVDSFLDALNTGKTTATISQEAWGPCLRHKFNGIEMLLPPPGSSGVDPLP